LEAVLSGPETLEGASFGSDQTRAAAAAFDVACATLRLDEAHPRAEAVARIILNLVLHRQPHDLSDSQELARRALVVLRFRRTISRNAVPPELPTETEPLSVSLNNQNLERLERLPELKMN
jgi:hypothetical protein